MAGTLLINASLPSVDMTLDGMSNDFVYSSATGDPTDNSFAITMPTLLHKFYDNAATGMTNPIKLYLAHSLAKASPIEYKAYNITGHLNGTPHGAPVWQYAINLSPAYYPATTTIIPEGVAAALSFRRDYGTDVEFVRDPVTHKVISRPRGQDRGRIYLGPLDGGCLVGDGTTYRCKLTTTFMNDCLKSFDQVSTFTDSGSHVWHLVQWSRKKASVADIVSTWMDDRPDYQRRRSDQSTTQVFGSFSY